MAKPAIFFVLCITLLGAVAGRAHASGDDKLQAREHFQRGSKYFQLGRFKEAVKEYEAAFELVDDPALLYNIAQAHRLDNNPERALFFYKSYLSRLPHAKNSGDVQARVVELEHLMAEQARAQRMPPTTAIGPDGAHATTEPPAPTAEPQTSATPPPAPVVTTTPAAPSVADRSDGRTKRRAGIGLLAGGGALVITGVVLSVLAGQAADQIKRDAGAGRRFDPGLESTGRAYDIAGPVLDAVGGAAAITGAVLVYLGARDGRRTHAQLVPTGGAGHVGLVYGGVF
jgi:tetratricopeptide (TPR) repeat protein